MKYDSHVHGDFSTDSQTTTAALIKKAKELNIGITITEHYDLDFPKKNKFIFDIDQYFKTYSKIRNDNFLLGIELGLKNNCAEGNKKINDDYDFDYVLGSVHFVDNIDIFSKDCYEGKTKKQSYERYFENILDCVKSHNFIDSLGHIDYIARYSIYEDKEIYYEDFKNIIDEILKTIIKNEIILEINTRRFKDEKHIQNLYRIYSQYKKMGGKYVTIGSDAHFEKDIYANFDKALNMIDKIGLKQVIFKNRELKVL